MVSGIRGVRTTALSTPPLLNDIHDPVVSIMGVAALATPLWSIKSFLWLPTSSHLCENHYLETDVCVQRP